MDLTLIYACMLSLGLGTVIGAPIVWLMKRLKARQSILQYVDLHKDKSGTPTIGGLIFILPTVITSLIFRHDIAMAMVAIGVTAAYAGIGFLDDFIKVIRHHNEGLKAYQKIIAQSGVAVIVSMYCYYNDSIKGSVIIPFTDISVDIGWWIIPVVFLLFIATTNAVNLLDGLDGLCTGVSSAIFAVLAVICIAMASSYAYYGNTIYAQNLESMSVLSMAMLGGLFAFMCYNNFPAKIFMGDTGSLAIGGLMACIFAFSGQILLIFLLGIMLVATCLSVIIQVIYFKITHGKRVWLMTPLHHHFQYRGVHENRIVAVYVMITVFMGLISLISAFRGGYV